MSSFVMLFLTLFGVLIITHLITGHKIYGQINSPFIIYILFIIINIFAAFTLIKRVKKNKRYYNDTQMTQGIG